MSWQIWVAGLAEHGLQPLFVEMPENLEAGGIGGGQKVLAICLMPMGVAGTHALMEWAVIEDPSGRDPTPALLSNPFLIETDAVTESKYNRLTLRRNQCQTTMVLLPSQHHSTSMLNFGDNPWKMPDVTEKFFVDGWGCNPFLLGNPSGARPDDDRLDFARFR